VLRCLQQHVFRANPKKCEFGRQEIEYLGHVNSGEGVRMDPKKIKDILNWPILRNIKALRGFLGLTSYYQRFIYNYVRIAQPLTQLIKKEKF